MELVAAPMSRCSTEFWTAVSYVTRLGQANEVGLLVPGLGLETFLDLVMDEKERRAGLQGGTPRTIEGPLYITDAPLSKGEARLDQDPERGEVLFMEGQVRDTAGKPLPGWDVGLIEVRHEPPPQRLTHAEITRRGSYGYPPAIFSERPRGPVSTLPSSAIVRFSQVPVKKGAGL